MRMSMKWTEETSVGGYLGGSINSATGTANAYNGTYTRRTCAMSTFSTLRQIPYLLDVSKTISPALAVEQMNGNQASPQRCRVSLLCW